MRPKGARDVDTLALGTRPRARDIVLGPEVAPASMAAALTALPLGAG